MANPTNPNRQRALQNQQRNQQQGKPARQQAREGFDPELLGKDVEVEQVKGVIRGKIVGVSKYWLKIIVNGEVVYLNKAYIVSIKPVVIKNGVPGGGNAGGQSARQ
jgi:hypothetical protein